MPQEEDLEMMYEMLLNSNQLNVRNKTAEETKAEQLYEVDSDRSIEIVDDDMLEAEYKMSI
jgi:hypothetical protein